MFDVLAAIVRRHRCAFPGCRRLVKGPLGSVCNYHRS
jgi:hypothetical protein